VARARGAVTEAGDLPTAAPTVDAPRHRREATGKVVRREMVSRAFSQQSQAEHDYRQMTNPHWEHDYLDSILSSGRALTGSVSVLKPGAPLGMAEGAPNAVTRTWQHAAWGYVHCVGELHAAQMYVGNALARADLVVGKTQPDGSVVQGFDGDEPVEGLDPAVAKEASDLIDALRGPSGGKSEILRAFGEKIFVIGEAYLIPEDTPRGMVFEVLSTQELMKNGDSFIRYYGPGWDPEPLPPDTTPIRVWRPDAQYGRIADSSVRSCLEILEELVVLTRLVRSASISRMALSGVFLLPDELDTPDDDESEDGNQSESMNPLATDIINAGAKSIDDPASAASWMPFLLQGPADLLQSVRHVPFQSDDELNIVHRAEALERLAMGLDLPPEVVTGHKNTTFSNAVQISQDSFVLHLEPALQLLCDALTIGYLWPAMAMARGISADHLENAPYPEDITSVAITFDARKLISRPDRLKEMVELYTHDLTFTAVKTSEIREALGLDPNAGPDDDEIAKRIDAYRLGRIREVIQATPADSVVPYDQAAQVPTKAVIPGQSEGAAHVEDGKVGEPQPAFNPVTQPSVGEAKPQGEGNFSRAAVAGAAEITVLRCMEKVGAALRSRAKDHQVEGVNNQDLARYLTEPVVGRLLEQGELDRIMAPELAALSRLAYSRVRLTEADAMVSATAKRVRQELFKPDGFRPEAFEAELLSL
jgi:hypothetical protein